RSLLCLVLGNKFFIRGIHSTSILQKKTPLSKRRGEKGVASSGDCPMLIGGKGSSTPPPSCASSSIPNANRPCWAGCKSRLALAPLLALAGLDQARLLALFGARVALQK